MTFTLAHHVPTPPEFVPFDPEDLHSTLGARFEKMVALHSDRVAVDDDLTRAVTYAELNQSANRIAHALLERSGVNFSQAVSTLLGFGPDMIMTLVAVWKAGLMLVPLEPTYPDSRNRFMLHDSGARLLLTDDKHRDRAAVYADNVDEILNVEEIIASSREDQNPGLDIPVDTYCSLTYTSGSTGKPKGVIHTHRKLIYHQFYSTLGYRFNAQDRDIHLASLSHVNSFLQIHSMLMNGGALLPYDLRTRPVEGLARFIRERRVTYTSLVPTIFRQMCLQLGDGDEFPDLRVFGIGGESARASDLDAFKRWFGNTSLKFNYATSETSTITQGFAESVDDVDREAIPIGYPFGQQEILLVDENDNPVSPGEVGEFVVRSRFMAPGYLNRPEASAEKFSVDADDPRLVTYRTGDLGQQVDGGWYVHRGRSDHQIKIRGFRVETGEIETALVSHPDISEAVVVAGEDSRSAMMVVGYIVPVDNRVIVLEGLRETLRKHLPEYMIPARFVVLDQIPYTMTGKIDRAGLPEIERTRPMLETSYVAPRTVTEERVAALWAAVLDLDRVGVDDPFFDLGGHSLLATELVSRLSHEYELSVSLEAFFAASTVAQMAALLDQHMTGDAAESPDAGGVEPVPREEYRVNPTDIDPGGD